MKRHRSGNTRAADIRQEKNVSVAACIPQHHLFSAWSNQRPTDQLAEMADSFHSVTDLGGKKTALGQRKTCRSLTGLDLVF